MGVGVETTMLSVAVVDVSYVEPHTSFMRMCVQTALSFRAGMVLVGIAWDD
jgi:hypothetical protein